jgi:putative protease
MELLIPAGNLEKLRTAVLYGADAVYAGVAGLSLRAESAEMNLADLATGIAEAHAKGVKVYAALNTFARNADLERVGRLAPELAALDVDAVILSDPGILRTVRRLAPALPIHLSTQANTTNSEAVRFWRDQGVRRIVLARELTLEEIAAVHRAAPEVELELFGHGAMCVAYSGRCFLSAFRNRRSSNQGDCTQPCRWEYRLVESTRATDPLILEEDDRYSYLLSSKDLRLIEHLPELAAAGVTSLKAEGRMKSAYYVAVVTRTYRWALDALEREGTEYRCRPEWLAELDKISNRGYTTGFYFAGERINEVNPEVKYRQTHDLVGTVLAYDPRLQRVRVGVRNQLKAGAEAELLLPDATIGLDTTAMTDEYGLPVTEAHNGYQVWFPLPEEAPVGVVVRRRMG